MVGTRPLGRVLWALCASFHAAHAGRQSEAARRVPGRLVTPRPAAPAGAGRVAGSGVAPTAPPVIVVVAPHRREPGPGAGAAPAAGLAALEGRVEQLEGRVPGLGEELERQARQLAGLAERGGARARGASGPPAAPAEAGVEAALASHEAVLATIKADMDGRLAALQSQLTSFETQMQGNLVAAKQELDTKFNTLEARVAVNEGKLKGVEENSLGNILGGGL